MTDRQRDQAWLEAQRAENLARANTNTEQRAMDGNYSTEQGAKDG